MPEKPFMYRDVLVTNIDVLVNHRIDSRQMCVSYADALIAKLY